MKRVGIGTPAPPPPPPPPAVEFTVEAVIRTQARHLAQTLGGMGMVEPAEVVVGVFTHGKPMLHVKMLAEDAHKLADALYAECDRAQQIVSL